MHMGSYKSLSFFQVGHTGWFHAFTEFWNHSHIGWDDVWSTWCFPLCSFRSCASKITVSRWCDNFQVSHLVAKFELQEPELTEKMPRKWLFQNCCSKDSTYQEWVLRHKLDKHYAWCVANAKFSSIFVFLTVAMVLTKSNIGPNKSL